MEGLLYDLAENDIVIRNNGTFGTALIDSQNCALISLSQVCLITNPVVGEQIGSKLQNRRAVNTSKVIASAVRAVEKDGGKNVSITINDKEQLQFFAAYD